MLDCAAAEHARAATASFAAVEKRDECIVASLTTEARRYFCTGGEVGDEGQQINQALTFPYLCSPTDTAGRQNFAASVCRNRSNASIADINPKAKQSSRRFGAVWSMFFAVHATKEFKRRRRLMQAPLLSSFAGILRQCSDGVCGERCLWAEAWSFAADATAMSTRSGKSLTRVHRNRCAGTKQDGGGSILRPSKGRT